MIINDSAIKGDTGEGITNSGKVTLNSVNLEVNSNSVSNDSTFEAISNSGQMIINNSEIFL